MMMGKYIYSFSKGGGDKIYLSPCPLVPLSPFVRRKGESKVTGDR